MNESQNNRKIVRITAAAPLVCDALFALWLFTEVGMEHSALSRVSMVLFAVGVLLWMCLTKKAFLSYWLPAAVLMILWGYLGARAFSAQPDVSMKVVRTLCVNLAFLFFLYQYFMLRRDMNRVFTVLIVTTLALSLYILVRCWPPDLVDENGLRFGAAIGINPNWIGMLAGTAFGLALYRALNKNAWWWIAVAALTCVILLTKSTKAYGMVAVFFAVLMLMRWPKRWGLKLFICALAAWLFFRFILDFMAIHFGFRFLDTFDRIFFHRVRYIYENLFMGAHHINSLTVRQELSAVGVKAFLERPLTGWGLDSFRFLPGANDMYSHNNYIELAVSGGVPMLLVFYAPPVVAVVRSIRAAKQNRTVLLALLLTVLLLVMDIGVVSYVDRTLLMIPLMLMAATRIAAAPEKDGDISRFFALVKNPFTIVRWCSTHGKLKNMDDERYLKLLYRGCMGKRLRLHPPVTFNEKQQWMKLFDRDPVYHTLADKLAVRDYVAERVGSDCLVPLLGAWDTADAIDFSVLPARFALKCTHDSGSVCLCADKAAFDAEEARAFLNGRLQKDYFTAGREWPYKGLQPRVMAETFIGSENGAPPDDYKFYCFDGVCKAVMRCTNRTRHSVNYLYFDRDFRLYPVNYETAEAVAAGKTYEAPARLAEMLALAERLSAGFRFIRVDLYLVDGKIYFGEMTLFDNSGFATDLTPEGDRLLGEFLRIEEAR